MSDTDKEIGVLFEQIEKLVRQRCNDNAASIVINYVCQSTNAGFIGRHSPLETYAIISAVQCNIVATLAGEKDFEKTEVDFCKLWN